MPYARLEAATLGDVNASYYYSARISRWPKFARGYGASAAQLAIPQSAF
jgi:hypothetical protein